MRAPVPVSVRGVPIDAAQAREHLLGELAAVARVHRRADHADDDVFPVELLHRDMRRIAQRDVDRLLDQLLDLARARVGREAGPELDSLRLTQRRHRRLDQHPVRDEDAIGPADQRRIEEAELPDDPLEAPGENAGLKADSLADAEGPIGDQHQPGEQVAKHLLGGETDDNGGEAAAHRQGARLQPRDAQRDDGHRQDRHEPEQEADRSRRARLQSPVERRSKGAGEHARQPPAEEHEHDHRGDPHLEAVAGKSVLRSVKQKRTPPIRARSSSAPPLERRAAAGSISEPSPTSRHTWVRDSKAVRVRGSSFLSTPCRFPPLAGSKTCVGSHH